MHDSWSVLSVVKGPGVLDRTIIATLKVAAAKLHEARIDRSPITSDCCTGVIQTNWDSHLVGGRSGILFRSQIDEESGSYFVNFLLSRDDLERGAEIIRDMEARSLGTYQTLSERIPVPDLYKFHDLRKHRLH